jgi:hypothetical protein
VITSVGVVAGTSGTSGTSGATGSAGTSGSSGTSPSGGDRNGLITTGSIVDTQQITGSLILGNTVISGSLIGNTVNGGLIKIQTEANISGSVQYNITGSSPISQSNIIMGGSGPTLPGLTGSVVISGSNNILLNGFRPNTLVTQGTYGYIGGSNNIGTAIPTLGTGSLLRPTISNNALQSGVSLQFTTSSLGQPSVASNLIYGGVTINHQSGSGNFTFNYVGGNGFTSNANTTTLGLNPITSANIIAGVTFPQITLNHNSSSIQYQGNIGGGMTVTNNYSSSVSTAVNNATVTGNILGGQSNTLVISGSNTSNRRTFDSNVVIGRSNVITSQHSGSSAGHLISTAILGDNLIVSASHTSTSNGGTVIVGRYNATGSLQESSQDAVFVVGTGTGAGSRRNAIHVDSSGSIRMTGSVLIAAPLNFGHQPSLVIGSFSENQAAANITGSVGVSGSINVSGSLFVNGVDISAGASGSSGTSGTSGQNGSSGTSGQNGSSGTSGVGDISGLITTGSFGVSQTISGSLLLSTGPNAGQPTPFVIQPFSNSSSAAVITGSVLISGSLILNGNTITSIDRNGLITTGSNADNDQYITGGLLISSSGNFNKPALTIKSGPNEGKIGVENGNFLYRNSSTYNTVIGDVSGISVSTPFTSGSEKNLLFTGFNLGFLSGSNNTVIAGAGGANFISGSNNTILGGVGNLQFGNGNLIIGGGITSTLMENVISIGTSNSPNLLYKSGSVVQMGYPTQVTGSLNATTVSSATGYQDITGTVSASLNLSTANVWFVDDDADPDGAHLDVTNLTDGQQISIVWNANYTGTRTVTFGSNIYKSGGGSSVNLEGNKKYLFTGAVYSGILYVKVNL